MRVDFDVAMEVAAHEALVRQTYKDSVGKLTWCIGMTSATGHRVDRYIGKPQSLQHCMNLYVWALTNYAEQVREVFKDHPLTQAQFAAAVSFHWNTGAIRTATWVKHFKAGDMEAASAAFMNWVTPKEVTERREKERDLFFAGKWSNTGTMTEYTRLRTNMQPDFTSGKRINVAEEMRLAFGAPADLVLDQAPQPDAVPAVPTLTPADPAADQPIIVSQPAPETAMPTQSGHNGGPALDPEKALSPIEQMNKPVTGATIGTGVTMPVGAALALLLQSSGWLPAEWGSGVNATAFGIVVGWAFTQLGNFIGAYRARDLRFTPKEPAT